MNNPITIKQIEDAINIHSDRWIGHCHFTSSKILQSGIIDGDLIYGTYIGPIHENSIFSTDFRPQHGWIELPDGSICDPTRWVFEDVDPYLYISTNNNLEYQKGDLKSIRSLLQTKLENDSNLKQIALDRSNGSFAIRYILNTDADFISYLDALWIFNLPKSLLTKPIHEFFNSIKISTLIDFTT
jgi:hypothetical protein